MCDEHEELLTDYEEKNWRAPRLGLLPLENRFHSVFIRDQNFIIISLCAHFAETFSLLCVPVSKQTEQ